MTFNKERVLEFVKARGAYIGIAFVLIVAAGVGTWAYYKQRDQVAGTQYAETFFVASLEFGATTGNGFPGSDTIVANFSQPVEAHHMHDHFETSPIVKGRFEQGGSPTEIRFVSERPFETGTDYIVTLKAGLGSTLGSELQEDFRRVLSLRFSANDYKILKNDKFSLLQSVSLDDPGALRAQVGSNIKQPSIKIYKTTDPELPIRDILTYQEPAYGYQVPDFTTDVSKLTVVATQEPVAHNDQVQLPAQTGIYLVQAISEDRVRSQVWVTVNITGVHFRQDDQKFLLAAQDLRTGQPATGFELKTYKVAEQQLSLLRQSSFSGLAEFSLAYPDTIDLAIARKGSEYLYIPVSVRGSLAELNVYQNLSNTWQGFLYTDRPIYKTQDSVKFRGILRKDNDGVYVLPPAGTKVTVHFRSENGSATVPQQEITTNEHGVFFGEFNVSSLAAGRYWIESAVGGNEFFSGSNAWFEILDYKKPSFELDARLDKEEYVEGDKVSVSLSGSNFNGQSFGRQQVTYKVYALDYYETEKAVYNKSFALNGWGGMCGGGGFGPFETYYGELVGQEQTLTTDNSGKINVTFDTKKLERNISQALTFVVEKKDNNGNIISDAQTAVVHNGEVNIFLRAFKNQPKSGPAPVAVFAAETLSGEKLGNREFTYTINQVGFQYASYNYGTPTRNSKPLTSGKVRTNSDGVGEFKVEGLDKLEPGYDTLEVNVETQDRRGNRIVGSQSLYAYGTGRQFETPVLLNVSSPQTNLVPGEKAQLKITAPEAMRVLLAFERGRVYDPQWLDLKAGDNTYEFTVKNSYAPTITPTFSAFYKNRYYSEGLTFNVPAMNKLVNVSVTTDKQQYGQGEVAKVTIKTTNQQGNPISSSLSLGVIDKAIFALRKSTQLPLHSSFYFFRPRRTNNSSSMTGISFGDSAERGGGGGGDSQFYGKDVDVLYWNPDLRTDNSGEVVVYMPVSGSTVWKGIIYTSTNTTDVGQTDFEFSSR